MVVLKGGSRAISHFKIILKIEKDKMKQEIMKRKMFSILFITLLINLNILLLFPTSPVIKSVNAESEWTQTSDLDFVYGSFNNVELVGNGEEASLSLRLVKDWMKLYPSTAPSARSYHAMAPIWGTDKVLLFGGLDKHNNYKADTWIYDLENNSWIKMNPPIKPRERCGHAMAPIHGTDMILLFGGEDPYWLSSETWIYDYSENIWIDVYQSDRPPRRRFHSMASIDGEKKVMLFGGEDYFYGFNDTWVYDFNSHHWIYLNLSYHPLPRINHKITTVFNTDKIMLFGGMYKHNATYNGSNVSNENYTNYHLRDDTWIFDLSEKKWTNATEIERPNPRVDHTLSSFWNTDKILLFGGYGNINNESRILDDSWIFNCKLKSWKNFTHKKGPPPLKDSAMINIYKSDINLLFGGYRNHLRTNESWIFKLYYDLKNGTYTSPPYDTSSNSSFHSIFWDAEIPNNTSIKFQIRTDITEKELLTKPFVGPNGDVSSYYELTPSSIWSEHKSDRFMQYKAYFNTTNKEELAVLHKVTITFNRYPDTKLINPINLAEISDTRPIFKWQMKDDSNDQVAFQVLIDNDNSFEKPNYDSGIQVKPSQKWQFPFGTSYSYLQDGEWYWKVRTKDKEGDWGAYSEPFKFTIDTKPPKSQILSLKDNSTFHFFVDISGNASDNVGGVGLKRVEISIKRLSDNNFWNNVKWVDNPKWLLAIGRDEWYYDPINIVWDSGIKYHIRSRAIDNASNIETQNNGIICTLDSDKPYSIIEHPADDNWLNNLKNITGHAVDIGSSEIDQVIISIKEITENVYWTGKIWSPEIVWLQAQGGDDWFYNASSIPWYEDSEYIIQSRAYDIVGNKEYPGAENYFKFDFKAPKKLDVQINNGQNYTKSHEVGLSLSAYDSKSGIHQMALSTDRNNMTSWENYDSYLSFTLPPGDGEKSIYFMVKDRANNIAGPVNDSIILDTTPPYDLLISINNGSAETNSTQVKLQLSAKDNTSGVSHMSFSSNGWNWSEWFEYNTSIIYYIPSGDGVKKVYFRVKDKVGNIAPATSAKILLNTTEPDIPRIHPDEEDFSFDLYQYSSIIWLMTLIVVTLILISISYLIYKKKNEQKELPLKPTLMAKPQKSQVMVDATVQKLDQQVEMIKDLESKQEPEIDSQKVKEKEN